MKSCTAILLGACVLAAVAQNVIEDRGAEAIASPIKVTESQTRAFIDHPLRSVAEPGSLTNRIARKLEAHVAEFLDGWPWMPFHHTLGISGYEVYFNHPDEMFYALSLALPFLSTNTASQARTFLARQLTELPPFSSEGFENQAGRPREAYDVPMNLRANGKGAARSAFGVYALWAYVDATGDSVAARKHWGAVKQRLEALLRNDYEFDPTNRKYVRDEAELLNGNLAALIGACRLARTNADAAIEVTALARVQQLLELRVNLARQNPRILEPTGSTTKHLHASKLARFCALTPEVGEAVRVLADGDGATRLRNFREARNGWYLAFGDRMIGGENYTNPPHFSRALFAGALFVEQLQPEQLAAFVDVPWCKGDFYFMEKSALTLAVTR